MLKIHTGGESGTLIPNPPGPKIKVHYLTLIQGHKDEILNHSISSQEASLTLKLGSGGFSGSLIPNLTSVFMSDLTLIQGQSLIQATSSLKASFTLKLGSGGFSGSLIINLTSVFT